MKINKKIEAFLEVIKIFREAGMELKAIKLKGLNPESLDYINISSKPDGSRIVHLFGVELL